MKWNNIYISDKTGEKFFNTTASELSTQSEVKNLNRHLDNAIKNPDLYKFLDIETAKVFINGEPVAKKLYDIDLSILDDLEL